MGFLATLFGGKKKEAPKAAAAPAAAGVAKPQVMGKTVSPAPVEHMTLGAPGAAQVKLRLKMAALMRSGEYAAAYKAARELAEIQVKAGRRIGARGWDEQADRILARADVTA
jgi:hypothetical protein